MLDDPIRYYAQPSESWSLGDIAIVPTAVLLATADRPLAEYPQPAPPADRSRSVVYKLWDSAGPLLSASVECWLGPAIILMDDCAIDKELNAYVERRMAQGIPLDQALREGRSDASLDPFILVAPLRPYRELRYANERSVRQAQPIGYFPVVGSRDMDEAYVDFVHTVPVSRNLLCGPAASLSEDARRILRWKIAEFYAYRNLSVDAEIMEALGKTITNVHVIKDSKDRLVVDLELDSGAASLRLRQEPRRAELPAGHERPRTV